MGFHLIFLDAFEWAQVGLWIAEKNRAALKTWEYAHAQAASPEPLSRRELEVLQLMAQGLTNQQIALGVTNAVSNPYCLEAL